MLKIIGWFMSIIGVIMTVVNTGKYMSTSQEIQPLAIIYLIELLQGIMTAA